MKYIVFFLFIFTIFSCKQETEESADRFKQGVFEIPGNESFGVTTITRVDSLQIETYTKKVSVFKDGKTIEKTEEYRDTLYIKWRNSFAYILRMKNPKTDLDKDPIFVQINKVTGNSYDYTAKIGYSKFKQKGTIFIKETNSK